MDQANAPMPGAVVEVKSCFGPIVSSNSRLLILGTLPGEESLIRRQYYGHPRNHFWPIIAATLGDVLPTSYDDRIAMLGRHRVALWDVLQSAQRVGSLDSKIENPIANDFGAFFASHPHIRTLAFNGNNAHKFFRRFVEKKQDLPLNRIRMLFLPATSPAYARPFEEKAAKWRDALAGATGSI
jgi:double-stranded uracil-DNA glycosylase